jgi:hypothetical protein
MPKRGFQDTRDEKGGNVTDNDALNEFRSDVERRAASGKLDSLKNAFERKLANNDYPEAEVILNVLTDYLPANDAFLSAGRAKLHRETQAVEPGRVSLERYCESATDLAWINRQWLGMVTTAIWQESLRFRRYTAPTSATFPIRERQFTRRTGVLSMRFVEDSASRVCVRFEIHGGRFCVLTIDRKLGPAGPLSPLHGVLTALAVAVYRDCVVAGETSSATKLGLSPQIGGGPVAGSRNSSVYTVPRSYAVGLRMSSHRSSTPVSRPVHEVIGHLRWLPPGFEAAAHQIALALAFGIMPGPNETFVRPYARGGIPTKSPSARVARSRTMAPSLLASLRHAVRWI